MAPGRSQRHITSQQSDPVDNGYVNSEDFWAKLEADYAAAVAPVREDLYRVDKPFTCPWSRNAPQWKSVVSSVKATTVHALPKQTSTRLRRLFYSTRELKLDRLPDDIPLLNAPKIRYADLDNRRNKRIPRYQFLHDTCKWPFEFGYPTDKASTLIQKVDARLLRIQELLVASSLLDFPPEVQDIPPEERLEALLDYRQEVTDYVLIELGALRNLLLNNQAKRHDAAHSLSDKHPNSARLLVARAQ